VWNCLIFFVGEYSSVWPEICRVLSQIQSRFLREISGKNYFGIIFHKFYWKPRLFSTETCEISPYFRQFYSRSVLHWKKFTQAFSYVFCTQVRRHAHKQITRRRYREEKLGCFVFGKPVLFTLVLGLTTPYSLGISVWKFYQSFAIVPTEFWLRFERQIRPTGFAINFLFITVRAARKVRLCVKLFDFFRGWTLIRLTWNFVAFCPKFSWDSYVKFQEKTIVRINGFKLDGGELFKENFRKLLEQEWIYLRKQLIQKFSLPKTASKSCSTRKTIGCFAKTIGCFAETIDCLYQQTTK